MSAQAPLISLMETSFGASFGASCVQPKLPAITSGIMSAFKPIDINLLLPQFNRNFPAILYPYSPPTLPRQCGDIRRNDPRNLAAEDNAIVPQEHRNFTGRGGHVWLSVKPCCGVRPRADLRTNRAI